MHDHLIVLRCYKFTTLSHYSNYVLTPVYHAFLIFCFHVYNEQPVEFILFFYVLFECVYQDECDTNHGSEMCTFFFRSCIGVLVFFVTHRYPGMPVVRRLTKTVPIQESE